MTNTPFFLVSFTATSVRCSRNAAACLLLLSSFSARCRTSWVLVMPEAMNPPLGGTLNFPAMRAWYTMLPVEKQRFSRILCGFFHLGTSKAHKHHVFSR